MCQLPAGSTPAPRTFMPVKMQTITMCDLARLGQVQILRPAPHGRKPEYSQQELRSCRIISSIWQVGKTAGFPSADSAVKRGMDSSLVRLV